MKNNMVKDFDKCKDDSLQKVCQQGWGIVCWGWGWGN